MKMARFSGHFQGAPELAGSSTVHSGLELVSSLKAQAAEWTHTLSPVANAWHYTRTLHGLSR